MIAALLSLLLVAVAPHLGQAAGCRYTIRKGDTFWNLSQKYGCSVSDMTSANPGVVPEHLQVGESINMPRACSGFHCGGGSPPPSRPSPQPPTSGGSDCNSDMIRLMVQLDAAARGRSGLGGVPCDQALSNQAYSWSREMCRRGGLSHDGMRERCKNAGHPGGCAENVLFRHDTNVNEAHGQWVRSSGHYKNLMHRDNKKSGFGWYICGDGRVYWTALYGR